LRVCSWGSLVEVLLDANETARRLRCTRRHLERLVADGKGPPSVRLGRLRRFPESLLDQWIKEKIEVMKVAVSAA
jgi:excisionase family DNA binding protein